MRETKGDDLLCKWLHLCLEELPLLHFPFDIRQLPKSGIYFFYEEGEIWGHGGNNLRITRIGTSRAGNFRNRISEHFLLDERKMEFDENRPAPHERSIFRKNIGRALLSKRDDEYLKIWDIDFTTRDNRHIQGHLRDIEKEKSLEKEITDILRNRFSFRYIAIDDNIPVIGSRGIESSLIGTVFKCPLCKASDRWLGNHSPKFQIRESGLWLVQHLNAGSLSSVEKAFLEKQLSLTRQLIEDAHK
ncbi:MAG: hypothetical protein JW854_15290 [Actinobacteria bacterium]|nr:hypothetical protein [Actinomycetota bacterium]